MDRLIGFFSFFLHFDRYLSGIVAQYGLATYGLLFLIIFLETGLVITPFLPGDSLLFAAGAFAGLGVLDVGWLFLIFTSAAIIGDTVNYQLGSFLGPKVFAERETRFFKKEYLERTRAFYAKYGGKTIILARFVPLVRTFAPFVAGVSQMNYWRFLSFNVAGGVIWTTIFLFTGYWFGNLPIVQRNFSLFILIIIAVSLLPGLAEYIRHRRGGGR